jgi:hypothetical protein
VAISLSKRVSLKILRKISFQVLGGQSGPLGRIVRGFFDIYLIPQIFGKSFRENALPGGQSAGLLRTVRYSLQDRTEQGAARWTGRTVRGALADDPPGPTASPASR